MSGKETGFGRDQRGASAIEFAIVFPVLILILFGIIEFGVAFFTQEVLTNASREGARAGIIQATPKPTESEIETVVMNYAQTAGITVTAGDIAVAGAGGVFPNPLTVTVTYLYAFQVLPKISGVPTSITLQAQTVMRHE